MKTLIAGILALLIGGSFAVAEDGSLSPNKKGNGISKKPQTPAPGGSINKAPAQGNANGNKGTKNDKDEKDNSIRRVR